MRGCFQPTRPLRLPRWGSRHVRTSTQPRIKHPAVKQLTNVKLLDLVERSKRENDATPGARLEASDLEAKGNHTRCQPTSSSAYLPQSPLIDPRLITARNRHRAEKPRHSKEKLPFQLKLEKNPYGTFRLPKNEKQADFFPAQALSTPPRVCLVTNLRLPSYFQIPFGLATHPKTEAPWHLPRLAIGSTPTLNTERDQEVNAITSKESAKAVTPKKSPSRVMSGTHFLGSRQILKYVSAMHNSTYRKMMPYRWKEDSSIRIPDIVWREDMDTFVLEILRKRIGKKLAYLASRPAAFIAASRGCEHISEQSQVGAVLWLGPDGAQDAAPEVGVQRSGPPPYAMHHYRSHYIPCYNLPYLLGSLHLRNLREATFSHFGGQYAVVKAKHGTVDVQLELWKLLGYLADQRGEADRAKKVVVEEEASNDFVFEDGEERDQGESVGKSM